MTSPAPVGEAGGGRRVLISIAALAVLAGFLAAGWHYLGPASGRGGVTDRRALEEAYGRLRDAILEGDDAAFFRMHSRQAREAAIRDFPLVRARYVSSPVPGREAFRREYGLTEAEILEGNPEDLVHRIMPFQSGWKVRAEMYRAARVHSVDVRREPVQGGGEEEVGVVQLDVSASLSLTPGENIPPEYLPTVIFIRDTDGWKRRWFFPGQK